VAQWLGWDSPSLIYNQGSGEDAFDFSSRSNSFNNIVLNASPGWNANLIVVRAPFHTGLDREYARAMGDLSNFTAMLAS